jgi:hypothetical protein
MTNCHDWEVTVRLYATAEGDALLVFKKSSWNTRRTIKELCGRWSMG